MMNYEPVLHLPLPEARAQLGYRNVKDEDIGAIADIWSEGAAMPIDPRKDEMAAAAE